jgi:hypothetical protein
MTAVPRNESYLPIGPYVAALAPYASHVRILYIINGPFTYYGFESFTRPDVSFTVEKPQEIFQPIHRAFYGVDVIIKNPAPDAVTIPNYPPSSPPWRRPWPLGRVIIPVLAGMVGLAVGLLLVVMLLRWKEAEARAQAQARKDKRTE